MSKFVYTSFSPNTRTKDLVVNLRILLSPWTWFKGPFNGKIIKSFEDRYPNFKAFTFNYARSGMYILFKSLGLQGEDEVLIQGYTCVAAVNPVVWSGAKVVYVDIDPKSGNISLEDLRNKVTDKTRVVLFQHTYGCSYGVEEAERICREKGIVLVEDCTNTIFGRHKDRLIGTFGDASIFSFGRDKAVSGVNGGLILVRKNSALNLASKMMEEYKKVKYPSLKWVFLELIYPLIWLLVKSFFNIKIGKLIHLVSTKLGLLPKATSEKEKKGLMDQDIPSLLPNSLAQLAFNQILDIEKINNHREKITHVYRTKLSGIKDLGEFVSVSGNTLLRYPFVVDDRDDLVEFLKKNNIYVGDWYTTPIAPSEVDLVAMGYVKGVCPVSENICKRIVNLPNHVNVSEEDAQRIVSLIKKYYGNKGNKK